MVVLKGGAVGGPFEEEGSFGVVGSEIEDTERDRRRPRGKGASGD